MQVIAQRWVAPVAPVYAAGDREDAVTVSQRVMVLLPLSVAGCIRTVDLRGPGDADPTHGDADCSPHSRVNPTTGHCEPCEAIDPRDVCPCGFVAEPAPFPACEGPEGSFTCTTPCTGDIGVCAAYGEIEGATVARSCSKLRECCDDLAADPGSTPCCPAYTSLLCLLGNGTGEFPYTFHCIDAECCESPCSDDVDCDTTFQSCQNDRCVPGCNVAEEVCLQNPQCQCEPLPTPLPLP